MLFRFLAIRHNRYHGGLGDANKRNAGNAIANRYRWGSSKWMLDANIIQDNMRRLIMGISKNGRPGVMYDSVSKVTYRGEGM
jgi:hypothetical protein